MSQVPNFPFHRPSLAGYRVSATPSIPGASLSKQGT